MSNFEDQVVEHVLERLLHDIDRGTPTTVWYTHFNTDGTSTTQQREVNVQHTIVSKLAQKLVEDTQTMERIQKKFDTMLASDDFRDQVAQKQADKLISWLEEKTSWYPQDRYANRDSFKKEVRAQVVKIVAQKQADRLLEKEDA